MKFPFLILDGPEAFTQCWEGRISEGDKRMRNSLIKVGTYSIIKYIAIDEFCLAVYSTCQEKLFTLHC